MNTILCIDDDGWVLGLLRECLEPRGYRVLVTTNTKVGPACLNFESVDLVLLDLNIPARDGFEVYRELQSSHPAVPVLFISGCERTFHQRKQELAGALGRVEFLQKPFSLAALYETIAAILPPVAGGASHEARETECIGRRLQQ